MTRHLDNPESCFVCRRRADGLGVEKNNRIGWLCQECCDGGYGKKAITMRAKAFDEYEAKALVRAGEAGGSFLDQIGETDLAKLDPPNYAVFCSIIVETFGEAMRQVVGRGLPAPASPEAIAAHLAVLDESEVP